MANLIEEIVERMHEVNRILASRSTVEEVSFDDALTLSLFYEDYKNTNKVIDAAEELAHSNVNVLLNQVIKLEDVFSKFLAFGLDMWRMVDFVAIAKTHDQEAAQSWNATKAKATKLWKQYQAESNRLDMMPFDSEEYKQLDIQCEKDKEAYEVASRQAIGLFSIYRQVEKLCAYVNYFEIQFLELLVSKMSQIAEAIRSDAEHLIEEGDA